MSAQKDFEMQVGGCCDKGPGLCLYTACCPCVAFYEAANNIGEDECTSLLYGVATFPFGLGCCVLTALGMQVAEKKDIENGCVKSCCCSCFDVCSCYSCRVVNESRVYRDEEIKRIAAPATASMQR